jgi:hypothetical protein
VLIVIVLLQAAIDHWLYTLLHHASGSSRGADFVTGMAFNSVLYVWLFGLQALLFELIASRNQAELNARNAAVAGEAAREIQAESACGAGDQHAVSFQQSGRGRGVRVHAFPSLILRSTNKPTVCKRNAGRRIDGFNPGEISTNPRMEKRKTSLDKSDRAPKLRFINKSMS